MPEDKDGGTPETKSYTAEEITKLLADATETGKKDGQNASWQHFQGVADKAVAEIRKTAGAENASQAETIAKMRTEHLESLPDGERDSAMIREMYAERNKPAPAAPASDNPGVQNAPVGSSNEEALQASINKSLEGLGIDTSKVDWGKGKDPAASMDTFLKSVIDQVKDSQSSETGGKTDDKDDEGDDSKGSESQKHIDTSRGAGDTNDFLSKDPQSIIASEPWKPLHGGMSG